MNNAKTPPVVIPAQAGIQTSHHLSTLDSRLRGNDRIKIDSTLFTRLV